MANSFKNDKRTSISSMDSILGIPFKVLDDGFVRVIDYMGSDESIVQAARVSYGKGTKKTSEDRTLIRYLMRNRHTSPFEMCEIKLHIRVPMDCWRQWIRHRTANVNEYSTRYSIAIESTQKTHPEKWRSQSQVNKQSSGEFLPIETGKILSERETQILTQIRKAYDERINLGVSREQARKDLSLSTYTEAYWKIDLHNLLHFLSLRMDKNAQNEIRNYANIIGHEIVSRWCPFTWEAFIDYRKDSIILSKFEIEIIKLIVLGKIDSAISLSKQKKLLSGSNLKVTREGLELEDKLKLLNLDIPWSKKNI